MKKNVKTNNSKMEDIRLAGGFGMKAARQDAENLLRRSVLSNLLWENVAYQDGESIAVQIRKLIPLVDPAVVANIAVEARNEQKLRHVPLLIAREMARLDSHKAYVSQLLPIIIKRADELSEFLSIYWSDDSTQSLSAQVKKGLSQAFHNFDEYQLAKYNRDGDVKLRDVMFLSHSKPRNRTEEILFSKLAENKLDTPDTWEVGLSTGSDKAETFSRLIQEKKLGALAFLKNLRGMIDAGVEHKTILQGFNTVKTDMLLPINFTNAAKYAPTYEREIEDLMYKCLAEFPKLNGHTVFVVDVSGSMDSKISVKSEANRIQVAESLAMLASEMCDSVSVYATAGSDSTRIHKTKLLKPRRGFALMNDIMDCKDELGGGGIFTRQCIDYIKSVEKKEVDRIIVFSDSQDCDLKDKLPHPFGRYNYICDVSSHSNGINYRGVWTAEITGWSENFLKYIAAYEGMMN